MKEPTVFKQTPDVDKKDHAIFPAKFLGITGCYIFISKNLVQIIDDGEEFIVLKRK